MTQKNNEIINKNHNDNVLTQSKSQTLSNETANNSSYFNFKIETLEDIEKLANYVAKSPIFNIQYLETIDGVKQANVPSIITSLMLGTELGFKPVESITLGRFLNRDAILKVHLGKSLGLSPIQSIRSIYVFPVNGRDELYTSIHVVNKVLSDAKIKREIIENGSPQRLYFNAKTNIEIIDYSTNPQKYLDITDKAISEISKLISNEENRGKIPIISKTIRRALVKLIRGDETVAIPYSEQQAIDAGLLGGTDRWGNQIKGKDNWNNHTSTMLLKMSIMLGARIIASDKLHGVYERDELPVKVSNVNKSNNVTDVEVEIEQI
jgi:hypothetical protein